MNEEEYRHPKWKRTEGKWYEQRLGGRNGSVVEGDGGKAVARISA